MSDEKPSYQELERRLAEAESAIAALRGHEVDAVIGDRQIAYVRLKEVEDALAAKTRQLEELNRELEHMVAERTEVAEKRASLLQSMASDLLNAEQRERRRLSHLLHDHLQQLLAAAQMRAHLISSKISDESAGEMLEELSDLLTEAVEASRSLAVELSPPVLSHGLAASAEWLAEQMAAKHRLRVDVQIDGDADPGRQELLAFLLQAMRELLFNVVKHAGVSEAAVYIAREDRYLLLRVEDEGVGFDPSELKTDDDAAPTGSGLPSIRRRLELLGGTLEIDSTPGRGSTFRISLPVGNGVSEAEVERPPVRQASMRLATEPPGADLRVLVVDDHDIVREGLVGLLGDYDELEVVGEACDGATAVAMAAELEPNVIVMDVSMPGMDGIEATRRITDEQPQIRIVGLSMHEEGDVARQMREAGAASYVTKGGPCEELIAAIRGDGGPDEA
ncbi:MAG: response regulator [Armatimonadota bacterium]